MQDVSLFFSYQQLSNYSPVLYQSKEREKDLEIRILRALHVTSLESDPRILKNNRCSCHGIRVRHFGGNFIVTENADNVCKQFLKAVFAKR